MAAELQIVKADAMKQHLLSLAAPQQGKQGGLAEQQQRELRELLEQALAEYKQVKEGYDSDDPGDLLCVEYWQSLSLSWLRCSYLVW
jgi:hypothetical protein